MEEIFLKDLNEGYASLLRNYIEKVKDKVLGIVLFGSLARNQGLPFPKSDIDLVVIAEDLPEDLFERAKYVRAIEKTPSIIQSIWMTEEELTDHIQARAGYILDMIHEGIIIFDRGFLKKRIEKARGEIEEKGIRRIGKCWVWDIKRAGEVIEL